MSITSFVCEHVRSYPALQWQPRAARRAAARMAHAGVWLRERVALCRFARVPLSDLGGDSAVAVADMLMARSLQEQQVGGKDCMCHALRAVAVMDVCM